MITAGFLLPILFFQALFNAALGARDGSQQYPIRLAWFEQRGKDPNLVTSYLSSQTGLRVVAVSTANPINALAQDLIDLVEVDGVQGWLGWRRHGFDVLTAEVTGDAGDQPFYEAGAWVRSDSNINSLRELRGKRSCHTGLLKSAGSFMPIGYMLANPSESGLTYTMKSNEPPVDSANSSLKMIIDDFFSQSCAPPTVAGEAAGLCQICSSTGPCDSKNRYADYAGALRGLSEGACDVAFVRTSTWNEYCSRSLVDDVCVNCRNATCGPSEGCWCLEKSQLRLLKSFGRVASHAIMYQPGRLTDEARDKLLSAFLNMNTLSPSSLCGFGTGRADECKVKRFAAVIATGSQSRSQAHFGQMARNFEAVPGLQTYECGRTGVCPTGQSSSGSRTYGGALASLSLGLITMLVAGVTL